MLRIKFKQGNETWNENVRDVADDVISAFENVGNPRSESSIKFEIFREDILLSEGVYFFFCEEDEDDEFWFDIYESQSETIQTILEDCENEA